MPFRSGESEKYRDNAVVAVVRVNPKLFRWACARGRVDEADASARFPRFDDWLKGEKHPTLKKLEKFANFTHTPIGYFFLPEPPVELLPIRDLRTVRDRPSHPSADLLDTIYAMQRRQAFLREERVETGIEPLEFVGSAQLDSDPEGVGREMRRLAGIEEGWAAELARWNDAVGDLRRRIEDLGVLAVINGVVGNNTHRKLDVQEFRGFALTDPIAPVIFVNGADADSAKLFTLAHEFAHLWLGQLGEGLSGFEGVFPDDTWVEQFCNRAAAEFLVPAAELRQSWRAVANAPDVFERLARQFKVSPIVAARRALDLKLVDRGSFFDFYADYTGRELQRSKTSGGDFYNNQNTRVGQSFALAVAYAALEGRLSFRDAYELTGLNGGAFQQYVRRLGVSLP